MTLTKKHMKQSETNPRRYTHPNNVKNTLERSYASHLKDRWGYTGRVDITAIDRPGLEITLERLAEGIQEKIERERQIERLGKAQAAYPVRSKEYIERRAGLIGTLQHLVDSTNGLPENPDEATTLHMDRLDEACQAYRQMIQHLWLPTRELEWARGEIRVSIQKDRAVHGDYTLAETMLQQMGIVDYPQLGILRDEPSTVDEIRLIKAMESARWLIDKTRRYEAKGKQVEYLIALEAAEQAVF